MCMKHLCFIITPPRWLVFHIKTKSCQVPKSHKLWHHFLSCYAFIWPVCKHVVVLYDIAHVGCVCASLHSFCCLGCVLEPRFKVRVVITARPECQQPAIKPRHSVMPARALHTDTFYHLAVKWRSMTWDMKLASPEGSHRVMTDFYSPDGGSTEKPERFKVTTCHSEQGLWKRERKLWGLRQHAGKQQQ